jgi:hypothetical protein
MSFNANLIAHPHYVFKAMCALIEKGQIYTMQGDDWSTMDWDAGNSQVMPTEAEIATKAEELRVADVYGIPRKEAYPLIEEQLDKLYHDMTAGKLDATGEWHKAIKAVKDANPKS